MNNLPVYDEINKNVYDKRNKGAFYTPAEYAEISANMVRNAIKNKPLNNDYVIIDRCAGMGNLERFFTDEELKHCILNTIQESEYKELQKIYGTKVLSIISPSNALSKKFIDNDFIKKYLEDSSFTIILLENPPYSTSNSIENQKEGNGKKAGKWKDYFVPSEMKLNKVPCEDMVNAFIWSGFKYYLRQPTDAYIVYAPIKYWKKDHIINKEYSEAYLFNRKRFNAPHYAAISCISWKNVNADINKIDFECIDGEEHFQTSTEKVMTSLPKQAYPKDVITGSPGIYVSYDGYPKKLNATVKPIYDPNIIAYLVCNSTEFNNPRLHTCLTTAALAYGGGFYLTKQNFLKYLPLYCVGNFGNIHDEWYYTAFLMKSGDKAKQFFKDVNNGKLDILLKDCLIYTCLSRQNHCTTFIGDDGRTYNNELTLDKQFRETAATKAQEYFIKNLDTSFESCEKKSRILDLLYSFDELKAEYRKIKPNVNYNIGFYEICNELEKDHKDIKVRTDYIKKKNKEFYDKYIFPTLRDYEFIK